MADPIMEVPSWDDYFMNLVYVIASRSKDRRTHMGAVIVNHSHKVVSLGYNGFPKGLNDEIPERQLSPEKHFWFEHAERNAILNSSESLEGYTMYTNAIPCTDQGCARAIIQAGLSEVVVDAEWPTNDLLLERNRRTVEMFKEVRPEIKLRFHRIGQVICPVRFNDGIVSDLT